MAGPGDRLPKGREQTGAGRPGFDLIRAAYEGDLQNVRKALEDGTPLNTADDRTGLTALHIAVGSNNLALCRYLIEEWNAPFGPDKLGRWPTLIAAECQVDDDLSDYIVEQEARYLEKSQSS